MANEIDHVMDVAADDLTDVQLDDVIAYLRKMMALYEGGGKLKKEGAMAPGELLTKLALVPAPAPLKRRY